MKMLYQTTTLSQTLCPFLCLNLAGRDVIGLAETGSGKTGAFALPVLQSLLASPQRLHTLILTPTRELAFQISEQFEALGSSIGIKCGTCRSEVSRSALAGSNVVFLRF